jgi:outer membrane protein OmpA-like peptidoglycan-associated protein
MYISAESRLLCSTLTAALVSLTILAGSAEAAPVPQEGEGDLGSITTAGTECLTFLTDQRPVGLEVAASRQVLQVSFGPGETIFIAVDTTQPPAIGDQLEVVRATNELEHPDTGASMGIIIEQLGVVTVLDLAGSLALGRVEKTCREIEIGDSLRPFIPPEERPVIGELPPFDPIRLIEPEDGDATVVLGEVESVRSFRAGGDRSNSLSRAAYGGRDLVTIDQGAESGWAYGDIGMITSGTIPETYGVNIDVPPLILGRGVIIHADEGKALLKITDTNGVIELGAAVRNVGSALATGGRAGSGSGVGAGGAAGRAGNSPPTVSCRVERSSVRRGESVRVSATVADPDGNATSVSWTATAGSFDPAEGVSSTWSSEGLPVGSVTVTGVAVDGAGGQAACALLVYVTDQPVSTEPTTMGFDCHEFATGSAEVDNRCKAVLDEVALRMRQDPQSTVAITGYSDSTGAADRIQSLSEERAANAHAYLVESLGIEASRVTNRGLGASDPAAGDDTPEGRAKNRRIHLVLSIPSIP